MLDLEHHTGGAGGEEEQAGLHLCLYLVVDLEHKTGGVGGEEEQAGLHLSLYCGYLYIIIHTENSYMYLS